MHKNVMRSLTCKFHLCTCHIPKDSAESYIVLLHLQPTLPHHTGLPSYTLMIRWNHKSQIDINGI